MPDHDFPLDVRVNRRRYLGVAAVASAALAAVAVLVPGASSSPSGSTVVPSRVQVTAKEFYFQLSRHSVSAGPAIVELVNFGQDPHDLRLQLTGSKRVYDTPVIQPGKYYDLKVTLQPGKYQLYCGIANHRSLGMQATLVVKKR